MRGEGFAVDASVVKADANRARGMPGAEAVKWRGGERASRAVREYFEALEAANPVEDEEPAQPKKVSLTDPAARWTAAPGGPPTYAYSTNYLIDLEAGIIVDVEATPAHRTAEVDSYPSGEPVLTKGAEFRLILRKAASDVAATRRRDWQAA